MISLLPAIRLGVALPLLSFAVCAAEASDLRPASAPLVLAQSDPDAQPDDQQGAAGLLVRITRLEDQLRQMTGQIEQLQFQNKRLEDQLRKMQQDVDFRFQDLGRAQPGAVRTAPQKRGDLGVTDGSAPAVDQLAVVPPAAEVDDPPAAPPLAGRPVRKAGDAFDPSADPLAPGAPKPLGSAPPSEPLPPRVASRAPAGSVAVMGDSGPHAPLDLMPNAVIRPTDMAGLESSVPRPAPAVPDAAGSPAGNTRGEFDTDIGLYKGGQFDAAVTGLENFLHKYPKDRLVPEATFFLGESYARLGRHREAAEQFLKVSTDYTRSSRAPDALLRLGVALNALGAKEQACATYQEVDRKYPAASPDVRTNVERELKRARC